MKLNNRTPFIFLAIMAVWSILGTLAVAWTDRNPETPYLAIAILLFVATVSVAHSFRFSELLATVVGLAVYNGVFMYIHPVTLAGITPLAAGNLAILGVGFFGWQASRQVARLQNNLDHSNNVINDLRVKDPIFGTVRLPYALQTLKTETLRSQRYQSKLCLMLLQLADEDDLKKEKGQDAFRDLKRQACNILAGQLREMDLLFGQDYLGIILPETSGEAAVIVARRINEIMARKIRVGMHIGIAELGIDAFNDEELYHAAETAMRLAEKTDKSIVTFSQVQNLPEPGLVKN
jgi:GGDEF domain-containing protein